MVGPFTNSHNLITPKPSCSTLKFLCSYGGKILPRYPDGKLRYQGGETRVLAVERSISFAELMVKLGEICGTSMSLRCKLPNEDLDALVSITSDEDLFNLIEEYDRTATIIKIRAFLSPPKSLKKLLPNSPTHCTTNIITSSSPKSPPFYYSFTSPLGPGHGPWCGIVDQGQISPTTRRAQHVSSVWAKKGFPAVICYGDKALRKLHVPYHNGHGQTTSHWQL